MKDSVTVPEPLAAPLRLKTSPTFVPGGTGVKPLKLKLEYVMPSSVMLQEARSVKLHVPVAAFAEPEASRPIARADVKTALELNRGFMMEN